MLHIADNLKYLRDKRNLTQREAAEGMGMPRDRYRKYEDGINTPPAEMLLMISRYFHVSIDLLLTVDLRKTPENLLRLEDNRIVLPITVDSEGENLVEIVTGKAKAGYLNGYADPEYIESLQQISLPFLGPGKHRGFPVEGDSMPPHEDGAIIIGKYIDRLGDVMDGKTYILITKNDGMVYKRLNKNKKNALVVESDNHFYPAYEVRASDIVEIWEYTCSISRNDKKSTAPGIDDLTTVIRQMQKDMSEIKGRVF